MTVALERGNRLLLKSELFRLVKLAGRRVCIRCGKPLLEVLVASAVSAEARGSFCGGCIDWLGGEEGAALLAHAYWNPHREKVNL